MTKMGGDEALFCGDQLAMTDAAQFDVDAFEQETGLWRGHFWRKDGKAITIEGTTMSSFTTMVFPTKEAALSEAATIIEKIL